jgi:hypothetical protein
MDDIKDRMQLPVTIHLEELARNLIDNLSREDLACFIELVDIKTGDEDFSRRMRDYFSKEVQMLDESQNEANALGAGEEDYQLFPEEEGDDERGHK